MSRTGGPRGKAALYSQRPAGPGWTVGCRSCRAETPVSGTDLARRVLRLGSLWLPLARLARMPCPACGDTTWCRVRWRTGQSRRD